MDNISDEVKALYWKSKWNFPFLVQLIFYTKMKLPFKVPRLNPRSYRNMLVNMPINASLEPVKTWWSKQELFKKWN